MEKSKKTLKMIGICIIGLVIVVAVNMLKKPEDPFKNADGVKLGGYQHVEESNILNRKIMIHIMFISMKQEINNVKK